jgi:hypothetical protein
MLVGHARNGLAPPERRTRTRPSTGRRPMTRYSLDCHPSTDRSNTGRPQLPRMRRRRTL